MTSDQLTALDQLVEIQYITSDGRRRHASGVLASANLVVTARHGLRAVGSADQVKVRLANEIDETAWRVAEEIIHPDDGQLDAAILHLPTASSSGETTAPRSTIPPVHLDCFGPVDARALGFPWARRFTPRDDSTDGELGVRWDTDEIAGQLRPLSTARRSHLDLTVTTPTPDPVLDLSPGTADEKPIGWAGISGSPVLTSDGFLVGLIHTVDDNYRGKVLRVVRCTDIGDDPTLGSHLGPDWTTNGARQLSSTRAFGAGRVVIGFEPLVTVSKPPPDLTPIEILQAKYRIVPYVPRPKIEAAVDQWMLRDVGVSCGVVSGPGGAGKSRLIDEFARRYRAEGWATGLVENRSLAGHADRLFALSDLGRQLLLIIDYADYNARFVADLLRESASSALDRVRIVTVVRDGDRFTRTLKRDVGRLPDTSVEQILSIGADALPSQARLNHYRAAGSAYRDRLAGGSSTTDAHHLRPVVELATSNDSPSGNLGGSVPRPDLDLCPTPLLVHARALCDQLASVDDDKKRAAVTPAEIFDALLDREDHRHWEPRIGQLVGSEIGRWQVYAVATLVGAATPAVAEQALTAIDMPALVDRRGRLEVVEALSNPGHTRSLEPVEPDRLGEQLIARALLAHGLLPAVFEAAPRVEQRSRLLETMLRLMMSDIDEVSELARTTLYDLLRTHAGKLIEQAVEVAQGGEGIDSYELIQQLTVAFDVFDDPELLPDDLDGLNLPNLRSLDALVAQIWRLAADRAEKDQNLQRARELRIRQIEAIAGLGEVESLLDLTTSTLSQMGRAAPTTEDPYLAQVLTFGAAARLGVGDLDEGYEVARQGLVVSTGALAQHTVPSTDEFKRHLEAVAVFLVAALAVGSNDELEAVSSQTVDKLKQAGEWSLVVRAAGMRATFLALAGTNDRISDELIGLKQDLLSIPDAEDLDKTSLDVSLIVAFSRVGRLDEATDAARKLGARLFDGADAGKSDSDLVIVASALIVAAEVICDDDPELATDWARRAHKIVEDLSLGAESSYRYLRTHVSSMLALCLLRSGETFDAHRHGTEALETALGTDIEPTRVTIEMWVAPVVVNALLDVEYDEVELAIDRMRQAIESASAVESPVALGAAVRLRYSLFEICTNLDRHEDADAISSELVEALEAEVENGGLPVLLLLVNARLTRAISLAALDRFDEGIEQLHEAEQTASQLHHDAGGDQTLRLVFLCRALLASAKKEHGPPDEALSAIEWALATPLPERPNSLDRESRSELNNSLAELQGKRDLAADDSPPKQFTDLFPGDNRVVMGRYRGEPVAARTYRPIIVLGPQRSRKTTGVVVPTLLRWEGPAIVTSVRHDVVQGSIVHRQRQGGKVWIFEPTNRLFKPGGSALTTWSPVNGCEHWDTAVRTAHAFTESAQPPEGSSGVKDEAFWYAQAAQLLQPLLHAAALFGLSMAEVSRWARTEARAELQARLSQVANPEPLKVFTAVVDLPDVTKGGVYATLRSVLRAYDSEAVRASSIESDFTIEKFFDGKPNTLYLVSPPDVQEELAPIFTALTRSLITYAYHHQGDNHRLLLLLDEAGNIAKIKNLDTVATTAAGTKIQLVSVFHDLAQMNSVYGEAGSRNIINNHSGLLVLPGNRDPSTMDLVNKLLIDESNAGKRSKKRRSVRMLEPGTALCFYEHLPHEVIELLSSTHDEELAELAFPIPPDLAEPTYPW